jgi:hypothetical protein
MTNAFVKISHHSLVQLFHVVGYKYFIFSISVIYLFQGALQAA